MMDDLMLDELSVVENELVFCENCGNFCTFDVLWAYKFIIAGWIEEPRVIISKNTFREGDYFHFNGICKGCAKKLESVVLIDTKHPIGQYLKTLSRFLEGFYQIEDNVKNNIKDNLSLDMLDKIYHRGLEQLKKTKATATDEKKRHAVKKFLELARHFIYEYIVVHIENTKDYKKTIGTIQ